MIFRKPQVIWGDGGGKKPPWGGFGAELDRKSCFLTVSLWVKLTGWGDAEGQLRQRELTGELRAEKRITTML